MDSHAQESSSSHTPDLPHTYNTAHSSYIQGRQWVVCKHLSHVGANSQLTYAIKYHSFTSAAVLLHSPCTTPLQVATASRTRRRALWDTIQTAPLGTKWTRWIVVFTEWHLQTAGSFYITSINSKALITSCSCVYADTCIWFPCDKHEIAWTNTQEAQWRYSISPYTVGKLNTPQETHAFYSHILLFLNRSYIQFA